MRAPSYRWTMWKRDEKRRFDRPARESVRRPRGARRSDVYRKRRHEVREAVTTSKSEQFFRLLSEAIDRGRVPLDEVKAGQQRVGRAEEDDRAPPQRSRRVAGRREPDGARTADEREKTHAGPLTTTQSRRCDSPPQSTRAGRPSCRLLQLVQEWLKPEAEGLLPAQALLRDKLLDAKVCACLARLLEDINLAAIDISIMSNLERPQADRRDGCRNMCSPSAFTQRRGNDNFGLAIHRRG